MGEPQAPRGRAALLEKLRQRKVQQVGIQPSEPTPDPEPERKPTGRAALLKKIQESRQKKIGNDAVASTLVPALSAQTTNEAKDISRITEDISNLVINEREPVTYRGEFNMNILNYLVMKLFT